MEIRTSRRHRKCKYKSCKNILSIYNHEAYCHVHRRSEILREDKVKDRSMSVLIER